MFVRPGHGLSAGFETWGLLGAPILFLIPTLRRTVIASCLALTAAASIYAPFALSGDFHMFDLHWSIAGRDRSATLRPELPVHLAHAASRSRDRRRNRIRARPHPPTPHQHLHLGRARGNLDLSPLPRSRPLPLLLGYRTATDPDRDRPGNHRPIRVRRAAAAAIRPSIPSDAKTARSLHETHRASATSDRELNKRNEFIVATSHRD